MKQLLIAILFVTLLMGCEGSTDNDNETTDPSIEAVVIANNSEATTSMTSFDTSDADFLVKGTIKNAAGSNINAIWFYDPSNPIEIAQLDTDVTTDDEPFLLMITSPYGGFPEGDYAVELYLDDELLETYAFTVTHQSGTTPSFLVGEYMYSYSPDDVPVNIVNHTYTIHSDGTYQEHYVWSSKTISSTSESTINGTWEYLDGFITLTNQSGYSYSLEVQGQTLVLDGSYWNDVTLYFIKPWSE